MPDIDLSTDPGFFALLADSYRSLVGSSLTAADQGPYLPAYEPVHGRGRTRAPDRCVPGSRSVSRADFGLALGCPPGRG